MFHDKVRNGGPVMSIAAGFTKGLTVGAIATLVAGGLGLYLLNVLGLVAVSVVHVPEIQEVVGWAYANLGLSLLPFSLTLGLYCRSLWALRQLLGRQAPVAQVAQAEHLADIWTSLFFGIGVIWTAIGMRSALLFALGDGNIVAAAGAFAVLQRLVDGGILTALSTTIVGGAGGYLMRVAKTLLLGPQLKRYYSLLDQHQAESIRQLLGHAASDTERPALKPCAGGT